MKIGIRILILSFSAALLYSCAEEEKENKKFVRPVKYQQVGFSGEETVRTFSGAAQTDKIINLSFRSSGIITELNIKIGQKVKKGMLLARLDNVQPRLSLEQAMTQQNSAQSQMNTAKLNLDRIRTLYEKGSASLSDYESAKNSYRTALESYESTKRTVAIQEEQVQYGYLYAPEDGVIAAVNSEIDENVNPGKTIATLNAGSEMEIAIGIPESTINGIIEGGEVNVDFPALPGRLFKGEISEVSPSVDPTSSTYPVTVKVINPSSEIRSGMAANVTIQFKSNKKIEDVLVVPVYAVGEDSDGNFVFIIVEEANTTKVKKQAVTLGNLTASGFEIKSGLSSGQKIATAGLQTLLDGQEVKLQ